MRYALSAAVLLPTGLLLVRYTLCNGRINEDELLHSDLILRFGHGSALAAHVAIHDRKLESWLRLPFRKQLVTPVPISYAQHLKAIEDREGP
jgi:hypothetical protein